MSSSQSRFETPALGEPIPDSRHACISSLPTFEDVCGYETKDPRVIDAMKTGYPRFFTHPLLLQCHALAKSEIAGEEDEVVLLNSDRGLRQAEYYLQGLDWLQVKDWEGTTALIYKANEPRADRLKSFLQHTGCRISSRRAEAILVKRGVLNSYQEEEITTDTSEATQQINEVMNELYPEIPESHRFLANSGMNAFYSVFRFLQTRAQQKGKKRWLQLGWLYLDTMEILKKFIPEDHELVVITKPGNTEEILNQLQSTPNEWAGVITEFPTNPLLDCFDLPLIGKWCQEHKVPLVVDPTLVTAWNVNLFPHADIVVTSYTKYASSEGDIMAGGVAVRPGMENAEALIQELPEILEPLYEKDLGRLAVEIQDMKFVAHQTGIHNRILVERLKNHPGVKRVHIADQGPTAHLFEKVKRENGGPASMATVVFENPVAVFDALRMGKGPSFGLKFSLCCPFLYLAHYDMVTTEEGCQELRSRGLEPELIRFSFGLEDPEEIWERLEEALAAAQR